MGELEIAARNRLEQLFVACDRKGSGFLGPKELRELCAGLGLAASDADALFADLDRDGDGRINFDDFAAGFREFVVDCGGENQISAAKNVTQNAKINDANETMEVDKKRKEAVVIWRQFIKQIDKKVEKVISSEHLQELEKLFVATPPSPQLLGSFKKLFGDLIAHVDRVEKENVHLEKSFKRERESHKQHLKQLEEEMERQISQLRENVQQQIKEETEAENRALRAQLEAEKAELQAHLALYQSFGNFIKQDQGEHNEKIRLAQGKLDEANQDNRQLRLSLAEMQTNVALLRSDLAQLRTHYEEKCKELHKEKEELFEYMHEHDHLSRQLQLLHEANKRLQDINDHLRGNISSTQIYNQISNFRRSITNVKEVVGNLMCDETHERNARNSLCNDRILTRTCSYPESEPKSNDFNDEITYGLKRLMDDIDSGLSTMKDTTELDESPWDDIEDGAQNRTSQSLPSLEMDENQSKNFVPTERKITEEEKEKEEEEEPLATSTPTGIPLKTICNLAEPRMLLSLPERTFKVVFAGDASVGKSSFILRASVGEFVPNLKSTLSVDYKMSHLQVDDVNVTLQLWDTAGQERFRCISKNYFRKADGIMLLFDCTNEKSFLNVRNWMETIDEIADKQIPILLCANKIDLRGTAQLRSQIVVHPEDGERLAREFGAIYVETSAKNGDNVMDAVAQLSRQMIATEDREVKFRSNVIDVGQQATQKRGCGCRQ